MVNTTLDIIDMKKEILNSLRANINSYDVKTRIEEVTKSLTYDATGYYFLSSRLSFIKDIKVNAVSLKYGTEWTVILQGPNIGSLQIISGASSGDTLTVIYGENTTGNFIYQDFPRDDLTENSYPRIGFMLNFNTTPGGATGGAGYANKHEGLLQIKVVDSDTYNIDVLINYIKNYLGQNCKNFYNFSFITQTSVAEYDNFSDNTKKTFSKFISFAIPDKFEVIEFA